MCVCLCVPVRERYQLWMARRGFSEKMTFNMRPEAAGRGIIARTWKQPRCPLADKWIRKLWYIYTMEYYSPLKKNVFESFLMKCMKLEPIIQSEVSQKEKHQCSISLHIYGI